MDEGDRCNGAQVSRQPAKDLPWRLSHTHRQPPRSRATLPVVAFVNPARLFDPAGNDLPAPFRLSPCGGLKQYQPGDGILRALGLARITRRSPSLQSKRPATCLG